MDTIAAAVERIGEEPGIFSNAKTHGRHRINARETRLRGFIIRIVFARRAQGRSFSGMDRAKLLLIMARKIDLS